MVGLRSIVIKFSAFAALSAVLLVLLVNTMLNGLGEESRDFLADFEDVSGLRTGDDVKVAGVRVGRVSSIDVTTDGAQVGFELAVDQPILDTTAVVMRYQNLLGQRYLALVQGPDRGADLPAGTTIPMTMTSPGFDLTELLNGFRPLFQVLQPSDVNDLATSLVKVLQGEGGTVETLLQQTARLTTFIADRDALIGDVLTNLTPVLTNLNGQGTELSSTIVELRRLMTGLAQDRAQIGSSIDAVSQLVGSTAGLLRDIKEPAVATVKEFRTVAAMLADTRALLNEALASFGSTFESLGRATSYENALNVYVCSLNLSLGQLDLAPTGNGPYSEVCR
ncbi:MCE family protein [Nocardioides salsibiostraticola]